MRELNQQEIDLMNKVKALGPQIETVLQEIDIFLKSQKAEEANEVLLLTRRINATPERFLAMAKTELQTGLMYATRAVAQPEFF